MVGGERRSQTSKQIATIYLQMCKFYKKKKVSERERETVTEKVLITRVLSLEEGILKLI